MRSNLVEILLESRKSLKIIDFKSLPFLNPLLNLAGYAEETNSYLKEVIGMPTRVLFLCTGNSARSQMAEAFLRNYGGDNFEVHSAGLEPKSLHPLSIQVMKEIGLDISHHQSKGVGVYLGKSFFNTLITVCDEADKNCPTTWPGVTQRLHWSFEDPAALQGNYDKQIAKFRQVRDQIEQKIKDWLQAQE